MPFTSLQNLLGIFRHALLSDLRVQGRTFSLENDSVFPVSYSMSGRAWCVPSPVLAGTAVTQHPHLARTLKDIISPCRCGAINDDAKCLWRTATLAMETQISTLHILYISVVKCVV